MKQRRLIRHLLVIAAVSIAAFVSVQVYLNLPKKAEQNEVTERTSQESDLVLVDVSFTETANGKPVWTLRAKQADYSKSGNQVNLKEVEVVFLGEENSERARLSARQGSADLETSEVVARGDVVLVTPEGGRFETDKLTYSHPTRELLTDEQVVFNYLGALIRGQGMKYALDTKLLLLESSVEADVLYGE